MRCPNYQRGCQQQMLAGKEFQTVLNHLQVGPDFCSAALFLLCFEESNLPLASSCLASINRSASSMFRIVKTARSLCFARMLPITRPAVRTAPPNALTAFKTSRRGRRKLTRLEWKKVCLVAE
jgi:hypothetical protein